MKKETLAAKTEKSLEPYENREVLHRTPERALFLLKSWAKGKSCGASVTKVIIHK